MRISFRKSLLVGSIVSLALIILAGALTVVMYQRQSKKAEWVSHTYQVLNVIKDVNNTIKDARSARRTYRGTRDVKFLEIYEASLIACDTLQINLQRMIFNNPQQLKICQKLKNHTANFVAYSSSIPAYEVNTPMSYKLAVVRKETELMNAIAIDIAQLTKNENLLLNARTAANKRLIDTVLIILVVSIIITLVIVISLIILVSSEFRKRLEFQQQLRESNIELKKAVQEKEEINAQLERFSYVVAHDLKSPLSGVIGAAEVLGMDKRLTQYEDIKKMSSLLYDTSLKLSDRISAVLEYSRVSNSNQRMEEVDVQRLVENIIYFLFPPRHIKTVIKDRLPILKGQKTKLQQIFQNLISNAIKYNDKKEGVIEIGVTDKDEFYEFYISDDGQGIKEEDREKIFGLFETADNSSTRDSSTGIGLNLLKTLIEEQGGKIWVESAPGKGSTFYFLWHK